MASVTGIGISICPPPTFCRRTSLWQSFDRARTSHSLTYVQLRILLSTTRSGFDRVYWSITGHSTSIQNKTQYFTAPAHRVASGRSTGTAHYRDLRKWLRSRNDCRGATPSFFNSSGFHARLRCQARQASAEAGLPDCEQPVRDRRASQDSSTHRRAAQPRNREDPRLARGRRWW